MRASCLLGLLLASTSITAAPRPDPLPLVVITRDDTVITQSCRVVFPLVIQDTNGNGVVQIGASNVILEFAHDTELRGAPPETNGDRLRGIGIRIEDDVLVTEGGHEVLTADVPKDRDSIRKLRAKAFAG